MSATIDVGDAFELTFNATTGATVTVSWFDPNGTAVTDQATVSENPAGSGQFPVTLIPTVAGMWEARFTASGAATAIDSFWVRAAAITGPPPLATVGEVKEQLGSMTTAQERQATALLRAASKLVRQNYPYVDAQIAAGALDPEVVGLAVVNMVLRVLRNPEGLRAKTTGPFSRTYDTGKAAGLLYIGDVEAGMLVPTTTVQAGIGTIMAKPGLAPAPWGARPWMGGRRGRNWSIG